PDRLLLPRICTVQPVMLASCGTAVGAAHTEFQLTSLPLDPVLPVGPPDSLALTRTLASPLPSRTPMLARPRPSKMWVAARVAVLLRLSMTSVPLNEKPPVSGHGAVQATVRAMAAAGSYA